MRLNKPASKVDITEREKRRLEPEEPYNIWYGRNAVLNNIIETVHQGVFEDVLC